MCALPGCGAFNGDVPLKAFIQLVAAGLSGRSIRYFTFGDRQCDGLNECVQLMHQLQMTIGEAMKHTIDYARRKLRRDNSLETSLLDYVNKLQRSSDGSLVRMDKSGGVQNRQRQTTRGPEMGTENKSEQDGKEIGEGSKEAAEDDGVVPDNLESWDMVLDEEDEDVGLAMKERLEKADRANSSFEAE